MSLHDKKHNRTKINCFFNAISVDRSNRTILSNLKMNTNFIPVGFPAMGIPGMGRGIPVQPLMPGMAPGMAPPLLLPGMPPPANIIPIHNPPLRMRVLNPPVPQNDPAELPAKIEIEKDEPLDTEHNTRFDMGNNNFFFALAALRPAIQNEVFKG